MGGLVGVGLGPGGAEDGVGVAAGVGVAVGAGVRVGVGVGVGTGIAVAVGIDVGVVVGSSAVNLSQANMVTSTMTIITGSAFTLSSGPLLECTNRVLKNSFDHLPGPVPIG